MKEFQATLIPFDLQNQLPIEIDCRGRISELRALDIVFTLSGDLENISLDSPVANGQRTDNLWEKTCFEIFIKSHNSPAYWEYNLSPSTNWAIYGFNAYRQGKFDELSIGTLPVNIRREPSQFILSCKIPLPEPLFKQKLQIGLSSVVQDNNGVIYYYALKHTKSQADFHAEDSFNITVTAE